MGDSYAATDFFLHSVSDARKILDQKEIELQRERNSMRSFIRKNVDQFRDLLASTAIAKTACVSYGIKLDAGVLDTAPLSLSDEDLSLLREVLINKGIASLLADTSPLSLLTATAIYLIYGGTDDLKEQCVSMAARVAGLTQSVDELAVAYIVMFLLTKDDSADPIAHITATLRSLLARMIGPRVGRDFQKIDQAVTLINRLADSDTVVQAASKIHGSNLVSPDLVNMFIDRVKFGKSLNIDPPVIASEIHAIFIILHPTGLDSIVDPADISPRTSSFSVRDVFTDSGNWVNDCQSLVESSIPAMSVDELSTLLESSHKWASVSALDLWKLVLRPAVERRLHKEAVKGLESFDIAQHARQRSKDKDPKTQETVNRAMFADLEEAAASVGLSALLRAGRLKASWQRRITKVAEILHPAPTAVEAAVRSLDRYAASEPTDPAAILAVISVANELGILSPEAVKRLAGAFFEIQLRDAVKTYVSSVSASPDSGMSTALHALLSTTCDSIDCAIMICGPSPILRSVARTVLHGLTVSALWNAHHAKPVAPALAFQLGLDVSVLQRLTVLRVATPKRLEYYKDYDPVGCGVLGDYLTLAAAVSQAESESKEAETPTPMVQVEGDPETPSPATAEPSPTSTEPGPVHTRAPDAVLRAELQRAHNDMLKWYMAMNWKAVDAVVRSVRLRYLGLAAGS
ncbi:hypothetical protein J8273_0740 [Carpediemonas membranifera]|uniref:Uncharacterized protein n=1 Tax=Carpediemonas membranifera TaxID=201153 RepID=A0A8J6B236_9EUKA|nr:hypothetical protein J8273_0740 [Carpediemonas membranifera]|eukprot:KAG9397610.1 hypothetical protein J8273_0740 [Carpediemonas membranifera]